MPRAEVNIDVDMVRGLVEQQHPDLCELDLAVVPSGWDNAIYRLGDDLCVRLPRRELAARLIENEIRWLPELAGRLPVPVPVPVRTGRPASGYPWTWSICPWFEGQTALATGIGLPTSLARQVGNFLGSLHQPTPAGAPRNQYRGVPLLARDGDVQQMVKALDREIDTDRVLALWVQLLDIPDHPGPPKWIHGDLHPANIIVLDTHLAAVIDFGDLCAGDPAVDFAIGWMMFHSEARSTLRLAGRADFNTWQRARGWALVFGLALLAHSAGNEAYADLGRRTLTAACQPQ